MRFHNDSGTNWEAGYCEDRERLKDAFLACVHYLTDLQALQTKAVIENDPDFVRFDDLIQMARRAKDDAKYALVSHMENHCYLKACADLGITGESYRTQDPVPARRRSRGWRRPSFAIEPEPILAASSTPL